MKYNLNDMDDTMEAFAKSRLVSAQCEMTVVGGVNETNPLELLRIYEIQPPTIDSLVQLASLFLANKAVSFTINGEEVLSFEYKGQELGSCFKEHPELLDPCLKNCYNILLKKLTAPSINSVTGEAR